MPRLRQTPTFESIWDYPAKPRVEGSSARVQVIFNGFLVADTSRAHRLLVRGAAPQYYILPEDVQMAYLIRTGYQSAADAVGTASFYTLRVGDRASPNAAWCYPSAASGYEALIDCFAFHSARIDAAFVDGEPVHAPPREGDGGWVTRNVIGTSEGFPKGWRLERP